MLPAESLIRAAVGERDDAIGAFESWSESRDLTRLDPVELRFLPLVYRNLRNCGVPEEQIPPVAREMYKATWIRTRVLLPQVGAAISHLEGRAIEVILLKGAALVAGYYRDAGVRPMSDFDILVRPADAIRAASALEEEGWRAQTAVTPEAVTFLHAVVFQKGELTCDLHWRALWECRRARADDRLWSGAEEVVFETLRARILRPEHQLLHVIAHGTRKFDRTAQRWIADAITILRSRGGSFDWTLFVLEAEARKLQEPMARALEYLDIAFGEQVPAEVRKMLLLHPLSRWRRSQYAPVQSARGPTRGAAIRALLYIWAFETVDESLYNRVLWLPRNLQYGWSLPGLSRIPAEMIRRSFDSSRGLKSR